MRAIRSVAFIWKKCHFQDLHSGSYWENRSNQSLKLLDGKKTGKMGKNGEKWAMW